MGIREKYYSKSEHALWSIQQAAHYNANRAVTHKPPNKYAPTMVTAYRKISERYAFAKVPMVTFIQDIQR